MGFQIENGVLIRYEEEKGITEVVIPEGVTSIGDYAFEDCDSLTTIVIPQGVTSIGERAFERCNSLTDIVITEGVTRIADRAFYSCWSVISIHIPEGVTSIGSSAFYGCSSLTSIVIPHGVTSIGDSSFSGCKSLTSIIIPDSVMSIGEGAFQGCESLTRIVIPDRVSSIGNGAFRNCNGLTSIDIPKNVTSIGNEAFNWCTSLKSIVIPESVTSIGDGAFRNCYNLISIIILGGISCIEHEVFFGCSSLTSIIIPEGVTSIGNWAFYGCKRLTSIVIPEGVTSIGFRAFQLCESLTSINIPESVTSIEGYAFSGCRCLTEIIIPMGVSSISGWAFEGCIQLERIFIPESVTSIGNSAFIGCESLTNLAIPKCVTSIADFALQDCTSLKSILIPESVTNIGKEVFEGCAELKEIHNILSLILKGCKIHVSTYNWLLENIWNGPEYLSETAQVYLTNPGKAVNEICESSLFEDCAASVDVMLELIETNKDNASALKKIATFASTCGGELPREKLIAIYEGLKEIGAKPAVKILEKAVQSDGTPTLEGGTGHPIEAICLERYKEALVDKGLKDYGVSPKLFEGVRYKGSKTLAPPFVIKCAIYPYMQKLKELPRSIGGYQTDFVEVEPDSQIDEIAATLEREDLQALLGDLIFKFDPFKWRLLLPYCRYGSGKQMNALGPWARKWAVWGDYDAAGRRFIIVLHGAMLLNDSREAMFLAEKWGLLDEYARIRNTTADVLRDTVLTEFGLDEDGSKHYDLGNAVIAASVSQDLLVSLFNETDIKEVKSLPKKGADPEKYAAASEDFADLKKNIKNAVKSRVEKLKADFVSGRELNASNWKASYLNNYVLKRVASLLVWQWKHEDSTKRFMPTMDGTFIGCDGQPVEVSDEGSIAVAHPVEIPAEELDCWKSLLAEKQIAQPFVQIFEPKCDLDPFVVVSQYEGIELPMFLLRGLAKEGVKDIDFMYEGSYLGIKGKAITINANVISDGYFYTERAIPFDAIVSLNEVKFVGNPRAVNHDIYAMDKALIENRVRNGDIAAVQASSRVITAKTIQHLIDVSIQVEQMEVTAWLMNYKNEHFPYTFADLEL